ncbi:unnamed protein product [Kuraishia capsulata CBS 1993]|uniref:N-acetyltransferase domain-containing protein n=1 Tax=Kuraishia capsulata CBS 1993 TaxID=1382522 RepID=W6MLE2_9ASCO|nr:uncharacterized protein KUCA_T00003274001 [Kuraishia capsulata CBS 1993]CDK27296.1 unnamed protein product [Kuraishia capsulata CBS 1993]
MSKVELLTLADYKKAAATLYESFDDDDVARYVSNHLESDPERRKLADIALYEMYVYSHILRGQVVAVKGEDHESSDTFETVSVWVQPGALPVDSWWTLLRSGYLKLSWYTGLKGRKRVFQEMFPLLHDSAHEILGDDAEKAYFLVYLGSTPKARGKGNVRAIFEYMFSNYIDKNGFVSYLESSSLKNLPIYEKFGFRCVSDIWLGDKTNPKDSARMDVMVRGVKGEKWEQHDHVRKTRSYEPPKECALH